MTGGDQGSLLKTLINGRTQLQPQFLHRWFAHFNCCQPLIPPRIPTFPVGKRVGSQDNGQCQCSKGHEEFPLPLKAPKYLVTPNLERYHSGSFLLFLFSSNFFFFFLMSWVFIVLQALLCRVRGRALPSCGCRLSLVVPRGFFTERLLLLQSVGPAHGLW